MWFAKIVQRKLPFFSSHLHLFGYIPFPVLFAEAHIPSYWPYYVTFHLIFLLAFSTSWNSYLLVFYLSPPPEGRSFMGPGNGAWYIVESQEILVNTVSEYTHTQFVVVQSLRHVWLLAIPWTIAYHLVGLCPWDSLGKNTGGRFFTTESPGKPSSPPFNTYSNKCFLWRLMKGIQQTRTI